MTARELTVAALALAAGAGGVYVLDSGGRHEQVVLVKPADPSWAPLVTADAIILRAEIERAGAATDAHCEMVEFSNYSGCYCTSGTTGGWPTKSAECLDAVSVRGGNVWVRDAVK